MMELLSAKVADLLCSQHILVQSQQWKHQINVRDLFKVNNKCQNEVVDVVLVSLMLTLNRSRTLVFPLFL